MRNMMEKHRGHHYDPTLILILSAHIILPYCVSGIANTIDDIRKNDTLNILDNSSQVYEPPYDNTRQISDGIYESGNQSLAPLKTPNGTSNNDDGFYMLNEGHRLINKEKLDVNEQHRKKNVSNLLEKQEKPHNKSVSVTLMCNLTKPGSNCSNTTQIKGQNHPSNLSAVLSRLPQVQNRSHVNISASIFKYVSEKAKNNTSSKFLSALKTEKISTSASVLQDNISSVSYMDYTDYDYDTEQGLSTYEQEEQSTIIPTIISTVNDGTTKETHPDRPAKHTLSKHTRHGIIWQNKHYIRSVVIPVACGIIGALALVCVAYALRSCPTKNLYIHDDETFKADDDTVVVNDRLMLLVDSSDEEV